MPLLRIFAAILLPPLGIYLARGIGTEFWIGLLLTILAFLPGMIYALYIVATTERLSPMR